MSSIAELRRRIEILEETVQMLVNFIGERDELKLRAELDENGDLVYKRPSGLQ